MFFGRRGDAGFIGPLLWVCSGVVGFNVAMLSRLVRDDSRPARPDAGASAKKFALRAHNGQKLAFDGVPGEFFRGDGAGGVVLGEFFRGPAFVGSRWASLLCRRSSSGPSAGGVNPSMRS